MIIIEILAVIIIAAVMVGVIILNWYEIFDGEGLTPYYIGAAICIMAFVYLVSLYKRIKKRREERN